MAAQYSNRQFFRKTPNQYLAQYCQQKDIALNIDWASIKENDSGLIQAALNTLEASQITAIEADFQGVNALACEGGMKALADEAAFFNDEAFVGVITAIEGFHAKAMWAYLNKYKYWHGAAMFLHADNVSPSFWKKRNGLPSIAPCLDDEDTNQLAKAISAYFHNKEGRGKNCVVEAYRRNNKEYFFAYPEDFAQTAIEWVGNTLKNQAHHPAFEIIFVYCEAEGSLDIYAPRNTKALKDLQAMFATHILKLGTLPEGAIDDRVYALEPVLNNDFEFKVEPDSGIARVLITKMRLTLKRDNKQRITLEADAFKNENAVFDLLKKLDPPPHHITQLVLKVVFEPVGNQRAKTKNVTITYPNSCALHHDGLDLTIRQMLAKSGLEPKAVAG